VTVSERRTITTVRAMPLLAHVQHAMLETIEHAETIEDRLSTQERVDRWSDAHFVRAFHLADIVERDPGCAVEYARLIKQAIRQGLALDLIEDEHRSAAIDSATTIQDLGRATVTRLASAWPGGEEGAS
jgi:microcystin degradation protein MlrC